MIYTFNDVVKLLIASCFLGILFGSIWTYTVTIKRRKILLKKIQEYVHKSNEIIDHVNRVNEIYKNHSSNYNSINIEFTGRTTNDRICAIDVARFILPDNRVITIDRDSTEFYGNDGKYSMVWRRCYIWDTKGTNYLTFEDFQTVIKDIRFLEFEVDEEAPDNYAVAVEHWQIR